MPSFVRMDLTEVRGLATTLQNRARFVPQQAEAVIQAGSERVVKAIRAEIRALGLVETDHMEQSVSAEIHGLGFEAGPGVDYAIYQDQGTSTVAASDFTGKGFDQATPAIVDQLLGIATRGLG